MEEIKISNREVLNEAENYFPQYPDNGLGCTIYDPSCEDKQLGFDIGVSWLIEKLRKQGVNIIEID